MGKGENAGNQQILLFPAMFSAHPKKNLCFKFIIILSSANALNSDQSNILSVGEEFIMLFCTL